MSDVERIVRGRWSAQEESSSGLIGKEPERKMEARQLSRAGKCDDD